MHAAVVNIGFIVLVYYVLNKVYRLNRCVTVLLFVPSLMVLSTGL